MTFRPILVIVLFAFTIFAIGCHTPVLRQAPYLETAKWLKVKRQLPEEKVKTFKTLNEIKRYLNTFEYVKEDKDDWKVPSRFVAESGDCEDYAIYAYQAIKQNKLGDPVLILVRDPSQPQAHMIVRVGNWVFDNQYTYLLRVTDKKLLRYETIIEMK